MFKGLVKVGLVSMLAVGSLSAASYTAYIGCKVGGGQIEQPAYTCIKSIKLNGRLNTTFRTSGIVMGPERMPLGEHFLLEVEGSESIFTKYVRIVDSNNKEVYYDEDNKRYKFFKIKN